MRIDYFLSRIKHSILIPAARTLGFGEAWVASLRLSPSLRGLLRHPFRKSLAPRRRSVTASTPPLHNATTIAATMDIIAEGLSVEAALTWSDWVERTYPDKARSVLWARMTSLANRAPSLAQEYATKALADVPATDTRALRAIADLHLQAGELTRTIDILRSASDAGAVRHTLSRLQAQKHLLENGYPVGPRSSARQTDARPRTTLYLLHNSLPYSSGGYATRTHGLARGAAANNWTIECATRLGYPRDLSTLTRLRIPRTQMIDSVQYHRLLPPGNPYRTLDSKTYLDRNIAAVEDLAREQRPWVIHGASNHINGITANAVARRLGLRSVYEVRGLWELTRASRQPHYEGSEHYRLAERLEVEACNNADAVITITSALKSLMIRRGVDPAKIVVLPNGVDTSRFRPVPKDADLQQQLNLQNACVIGFIGSMPQYEGLEYLLYALRRLVDSGFADVRLLLVGDGDSLPQLRKLVVELDLSTHALCIGRVPHHDVERYYSLIDIAAFPRRRQPVCDIVSPLKPFEAMAMEIPVVASNVSAMAEFVADNVNGLVFKADDVDSLVDRLSLLASDAGLRRTIGQSAREWVVAERDWAQLGKRLIRLYDSL